MTAAAPPLYALRLVATGHYTIAKFSMPDFNVEAVYNLHAKGTGYACDCPASARVVKYKPCKHQRMLPFMMGACNSLRFYEPDSRSWVQPLPPELAAEGGSQVVGGNGHDEQPAVAHGVSIQRAQVEEVVQPTPPPPTSAPPTIRRRV